MKLILRQYLSDLRERDELDAILPDILSELGFNVLSRPSLGTRQAGVDVSAVGPDEEDGGRKKLFLFTIKSGDLKRSVWDNGSAQAVRPSLNEILDHYIMNRVSNEHRDLDIVICLCIGGEIKEDVRDQWKGFIESNTTKKIEFREWNGDKLAGLLLSGVLREELIGSEFQSIFRKSISMVDEPDIACRYFEDLVRRLLSGNNSMRNQLTRLRQVYICLWVLFVWARDAGNLESPFRASEFAILQIWNDCRSVSRKNKLGREKLNLLDQIIMLYLLISEELLTKLECYAKQPFALSVAVASRSSIDVNLALFQQFGRVCAFGIWHHWWARCKADPETQKAYTDKQNRAFKTAVDMITTNSTLKSPIRDDFAIEISLFLHLAQICDATDTASGYLEELVQRIVFSINRRGKYPIATVSYSDLAGHPQNQSDEYYHEHTCGSVLYPLLVAWLDRLNLHKSRSLLASCIQNKLPHTTQQVWVPDVNTENKIWRGNVDHGVAITGLPICGNPAQYSKILDQIVIDYTSFNDLSTTKTGVTPMLLMACRNFRLPVPPQLWFFDTDFQTTKSGTD